MSPRNRLWALVAAAAALWVFRGAWVDGGAVVGAAKGPDATARVVPARRGFEPSAADVCSTPTPLPQRAAWSASATTDPFKAAVRPLRAAAVAPAPVASAPPPPTAPVTPPPLRLPYRYLGGLSESGRASSVFLALGNTVITASPGDALEGGYRLVSIAPRELTFVHLQQNQTIRLSVEGETP